MGAAGFYKARIELYTAKLLKQKKQLAIVSLVRLVFFSAILYVFYLGISHKNVSYIYLGFVGLALFLMFVRWALSLRDQKKYTEQLLAVNVNEQHLLEGKPNTLRNGSVYSNADGYDEDLDIFGDNALFHILNRCSTPVGELKLAQIVQRPVIDKTFIKERQAAVQQLAQQPELREGILAAGLLHIDESINMPQMQEWLQTSKKLHASKLLQFARVVIPVYNISAFLYYLATDSIGYLLTGFAIAWLATGSLLKYINSQHQLISKKQNVLTQYASILRLFSKAETGGSGLLQQWKSYSTSANAAIHKLSQLAGMFDQRINLVVNLFLNNFLLYDIQIIMSLEKWKEKHAASFEQWVDTIADIESTSSLAAFAYNNAKLPYAELIDSNHLQITATDLGHPLISATKRVNNSYHTNSEKLLLITGSNMSGKTTFLRTLAVNIILAQAGAPVCATRFAYTPMYIYTSIRVNDSLKDETSYFMAELKRLHNIVAALKTGEPSLVLIDEILRGTNSDDKTSGSEAFIKQLIQYNTLTFFATHDLALAVLEEETRETVLNYCFESVIDNDQLHFDYALRRGVAQNKNASFLMRQMGIIPS